MIGIRVKVPRYILSALNMNGPIEDIPSLCATNAVPQMIAVSIKNIVDLTFLFIGTVLCMMKKNISQLYKKLRKRLIFQIRFSLCYEMEGDKNEKNSQINYRTYW